MNRKSFIRQLITSSKRLINQLETKLERDIISLLLIILLATAFVLKIEIIFWELTIQIPLIILGGVLYGGYYYFIVFGPKVLPKKLKWKETQTKVALSVLSMSAIIADVLIHDFGTSIGHVKLWMAIWVVIGAEALVELLAFLKNSIKAHKNKNNAISPRNNLKNRLVNRPNLRRKTSYKRNRKKLPKSINTCQEPLVPD